MKQGLFVLGMSLAVAACGGGSGGGSLSAKTGSEITAQFKVDVPVKGVSYSVYTNPALVSIQASAQTGDNGVMSCVKGELMAFSIKGVFLGSSRCEESMSLLKFTMQDYSLTQVAAILQTFAPKAGSQRDLSTFNAGSITLPDASSSDFDADIVTAAGSDFTPVTESNAAKELAKSVPANELAVLEKVKDKYFRVVEREVSNTLLESYDYKFSKSVVQIKKDENGFFYKQDIAEVQYDRESDLDPSNEFRCREDLQDQGKTCWDSSMDFKNKSHQKDVYPGRTYLTGTSLGGVHIYTGVVCSVDDYVYSADQCMDEAQQIGTVTENFTYKLSLSGAGNISGNTETVQTFKETSGKTQVGTRRTTTSGAVFNYAP